MSEQEQVLGVGVGSVFTGLSEYMTQPELAKELRVSVDTLRRWDARRIGPARIKMGMRVLYRRDAVREWLQSLERK